MLSRRNAGTHTPWPRRLKKAATPVPEREDTAYGSGLRSLGSLAGTTRQLRAVHAQRTAEQLSGRPGRQRIGEVKCLGYLETGEMALLTEISVKLGVARRCAAGDDKGLDALAQSVIRLPDHRALRDAGMRQQRVFDFLAADLDAAGVDDVVDPARHPEKVVIVETTEIAAAPPAVAKFLPRQFRVLPVADGQRRPGDRDLAGLASSGLVVEASTGGQGF
jgi:hypothetical protein